MGEIKSIKSSSSHSVCVKENTIFYLLFEQVCSIGQLTRDAQKNTHMVFHVLHNAIEKYTLACIL